MLMFISKHVNKVLASVLICGHYLQ